MAAVPRGEGRSVVLLGIDDPLVEQVRPPLAEAGFAVSREADPDDLLGRVSNEPVDCIVSAYRLSTADGIAVADALHERDPAVSVILAVRDGTESIAAKAVSAAVDGYLPMERITEDPSRLVDAVRESVDERPDQCPGCDEYRTLVEHFPNGLVTRFDRDLRYTVVGGTGFRDLDLSASDLEGKTPWDVFPPENADAIVRLYERALDGESSVRELELEGRTFRVQVLPVRNDHGEIVGGMTVSQDVTERRRREGQLRRYETVVETVDDAISWIDTDRRFTFVNQPLANLLDRSRDEIIDRQVDEVLEPIAGFSTETIDRITDAIDAVLDGETAQRRLEFTVEPNGQTRHRDLRFVPLTVEDDVVGLLGVSRDVTQRKKRERALAASERKYRALVDTAPDAIFLADAETGRILEANEAAADLVGRPPEEIAGMHQSALHPPDAVDAYQDLFRRHVDQGGTFRRLPDGRRIVVVDSEGNRTPVEISARAVQVDGRRIIHGIFRDISPQVWFEAALAALHETARDLGYVEDVHEIYRRTAVTAAELSELPVGIVYRFDEYEGALVPAARSPGTTRVVEDLSPVDPNDGPCWDAFRTGETIVLSADIETAPNPPEPLVSALIVPLGDAGVLLAGDDSSTAFDPAVVHVLEILASDAETALARTERERHLRERNLELDRRDRHLRRLSSATSCLSEAIPQVTTASTRGAIEGAVCEALAGIETVSGVWIGEHHDDAGEVSPRALAGGIGDYLDLVSPIRIDGSNEPAAATARTGDPVSVTNTARELRSEPWRRHALEAGLRSVLSVPIDDGEVRYGVLTVYGTEPDDLRGEIRHVVESMADSLLAALRSHRRRNALVTDRVTELAFRLDHGRAPLLRLAGQLPGSFSVREVIPVEDGRDAVTVASKGAPRDDIASTATTVAGIERAREVGRDGDTVLIQVTIDGGSLATTLATDGLVFRALSTEDGGYRLVLGVPPRVDLDAAVQIVTSRFPGAELVAKRAGVVRDASGGWADPDGVFDGLTRRQRQALELAFDRGYFEIPKESTGADIASEMGISATAFHDHLRAAERKLLTRIIDRDDVHASSWTAAE